MKIQNASSMVDQDGYSLRKGDWVKIMSAPDLSLMNEESRSECAYVFEYLKGKYKRIRNFDGKGFAEFDFRIPGEAGFGTHTVWIEPHLLKKKRKQK